MKIFPGKIIILPLVMVVCFFQTSIAQTIEAEWLACNIYPDSTYLKFENDTVFFKSTNEVGFEDFVAVSEYQLNEDTIVWKDLESPQQCNPEIVARYVYHIDGDQLSFDVIEDECDFRLEVLNNLLLKNVITEIVTLELKSKIKIYPNPIVDDLLTIEIKEEAVEAYKYELHDNFGRLILNGKIIGKSLIDLGMIEKGVYFISIRKEASEDIKSYKIVKH